MWLIDSSRSDDLQLLWDANLLFQKIDTKCATLSRQLKDFQTKSWDKIKDSFENKPNWAQLWLLPLSNNISPHITETNFATFEGCHGPAKKLIDRFGEEGAGKEWGKLRLLQIWTEGNEAKTEKTHPDLTQRTIFILKTFR